MVRLNEISLYSYKKGFGLRNAVQIGLCTEENNTYFVNGGFKEEQIFASPTLEYFRKVLPYIVGATLFWIDPIDYDMPSPGFHPTDVFKVIQEIRQRDFKNDFIIVDDLKFIQDRANPFYFADMLDKQYRVETSWTDFMSSFLGTHYAETKRFGSQGIMMFNPR